MYDKRINPLLLSVTNDWEGLQNQKERHFILLIELLDFTYSSPQFLYYCYYY